MGFKSEADMKEVAKPVLKEALGERDTKVVPEFSYSAGWTDLVYTYVSDAYLKRRVEGLDIRIPIEDKDRLKAFLQLHNRGPITKEYYLSLSNNKRSKKQALDWLISNGFVEETSDKKIRTAPYLRKHITTSFAVELKLSKWKSALKQAHRGKSFAEYQYVVLDSDHVEPALSHQSLFEKYNVGLISLSEDGSYEKLIQSKKQTPFSDLNTWTLNETILGQIS